MIFTQLRVDSFVCSVPGGLVERQVNTSLLIPRLKNTQSQLKPETKACQTQKNKTKKQGAYSQCQQEASVKTGLLPPMFSHYCPPPRKELYFCVIEPLKPQPANHLARMAQTMRQCSLNVLEALPLGLTSPTARLPYSGGKGPEHHAASDGFSGSELR